MAVLGPETRQDGPGLTGSSVFRPYLAKLTLPGFVRATFGFHFREKCVVFIGFYKGFVASRNFPPDPPDPPESAGIRRKRRQAGQNRPRVPRAGEQDDGSLPHKLPQIIIL